MKQAEILQALRLTKSKETNNYCSKLASIFEFIKVVKDTIKEAAIVLTGCTINSRGKLMDMVEIEKEYKYSRLNNYRYNDKAVQKLTDEQSKVRLQYGRVKDELWKKRKNKNNSELEGQRDELAAGINEFERQKEALVEAEKQRLEKLVFDIVEMRNELNLFEGNKINVTTDKGSYSFYLPVNNAFYYAACRLLNISFEMAGVETIDKTVLHTFITWPWHIENIKKAFACVSKDNLRPAMTGVCLDFKKEGLQIVATDAHRMYYSQRMNCEGIKEDTRIIIAPEGVKALCRLKMAQDTPLTITVYNDNTASFNGCEVRLIDARFPDYPVVIPQYDNYMAFDKDSFAANVKKVIPYANKATNQVNFHLNGNIALHSEDIDFAFECDAEMPYNSKNFEDLDIAFNGKFLLDTMATFKEKELKMYHCGGSNGQSKAAIFTNDNDSVLVMPIYLND